MDSKNILKSEKEELNEMKKLNNLFDNLKSDYFLEKIFNNIHKKKSLEIIKCNKKIQQRLNININNYKEYSEKYSSIEIEIIPTPNKYDNFIYFENEDDEKYYHIYFNNNKEKEIKRTFLKKDDNVSKINIIIDYQIESFTNLFYYCQCIKSIYFKKFVRNNITNMSCMFYNCSSLEELNLSNFNTNNVSNMSYMFWRCKSLKELNLSNFNINNETNVFGMFWECSEELKNKIKTQLKNINKNALYFP